MFGVAAVSYAGLRVRRGQRLLPSFPAVSMAPVRTPESYTPTGPFRQEYATPAEAQAAFGVLGQYFDWRESGVWPSDGSPIPHDVAVNMVVTARTYMDPLRAAFGPIIVTSWYRPPSVNAGTPGASETSAHMTGDAVDFKFRNHRNGYGAARDVAAELARRSIPWDQIIGYQTGTHRQHLGRVRPNGQQRMLVQEYHPGRAGTEYPVAGRYDASSFTQVA